MPQSADLAVPVRRWHAWLPPAVFALLALAMFADVLFGVGGRILSSARTDLVNHFVASREFGFGELSRGNLALWNPAMFCGYPYHGGFQPALLYPLNWLHLILPLDRAINLIIVLHTFLAGYFTFLWIRHGQILASLAATPDKPGSSATAAETRGDRPAEPDLHGTVNDMVAAILGGAIFMFCARFFLHIYAGHLPHVCLIPWTPLL
ncbi:MAG: hypothetical protein NZ561_02755, partial [Phycisphaerae bacterium]|nr:hypothetical protein [Phycisphaerae bacterium]MDW8261800.1 hypothetical protein [Phycisphaerales bacterium]